LNGGGGGGLVGVPLEISRIRPEFKVELPGSFLPLLPKAWRMTAAIGRLTVISVDRRRVYASVIMSVNFYEALI